MVVCETERLVLRLFQPGDEDFLVRLLNDPSFIINIEDKGVRTREQAGTFITRSLMGSYQTHGHGLYLVQRKETAEPIGMCGLLKRDHLQDIDLGYAFLPEYWGRGYALEAARAVLDYGRTILGRREAFAIVSPGNARSIALLAKLGFAYAQDLAMPDGSGTVALYAVSLLSPSDAAAR
ncbi:MAG: GNAT family N-acetyltransferase [Holophaga sp.]|jgi:RimJ/RimL family protein N-acetyltransferase